MEKGQAKRVQPARKKTAGFLFPKMKRHILILSCIVFLLSAKAYAAARYISLAPSTTEILFALGLEKEIIGVSSHCNYPPEALSKEDVGDFSSPNIEKILFLKPDYIFCTGLEQAPVIAQLKQLNMNVYVADPQTIQEMFSSILDIGRITGYEYNAQILVKQMSEELEEIRAITVAIPIQDRPKIFIEFWDAPLMTAGENSFINELLDLAGGINIASDLKRQYSVFSPEEVIKHNPDCIILAYMQKNDPKRTVAARLGWKDISAVKNNRIYDDINPDLLLRPGPRVVEGVRQIYEKCVLRK